ncbi:GL25077 [Drosophila persimilis]|uniref:GL25077 n=1 Tax=Drosophila persimilis TaxID=7234 RepID=B4GQV8_DROPE|nr:GL25077 [Drosophila persimilis]
MEHLRPLSYEEMCQMEMLQAGAAGGGAVGSAPPGMMPIMVIPTALLAPAAGTAGVSAPDGGAGGAAGVGAGPGGVLEHYYQLQPTQFLTTDGANGGELALLHGGEQLPNTIQLQQHPQPVNILCTGTLGRAPAVPTSAPHPAGAATLPRGFQPGRLCGGRRERL